MQTADPPRFGPGAAIAAYLVFVAYQSLAGGGLGGCGPALAQQGRPLAWSDGIANLVAYFPLGLLAGAWLEPWRAAAAPALRTGGTAARPGRVRFGAALLAIVAFSLGMELIQACLASRVSSWYDWATNSTGGLLGLLAWRAYAGSARRRARAAEREGLAVHPSQAATGRLRRSPLLWPVLLFVGAWLAMTLAPWRFTLDLGTVRANLAFLRHLPDWTGPEPWRFARHLFGWLALGVALRALLPGRARATLVFALVLAASLGGQLMLLRRALSLDELAAIGLAFALATAMPSRSAALVLARALPVLALLSVGAYQLAPQRGAFAGGFAWWPQLGRGGLLPALELSLLYCWLAFAVVLSLRWQASRGRQLGLRRFVAPAAVVALMLASELAQLGIRGRVPDSSAPLVTALAFVVAWALVGSPAEGRSSSGIRDRADPRSRRPVA